MFTASVNNAHEPDSIIPDRWRFTTERLRSWVQLNLTRWRPNAYISRHIHSYKHTVSATGTD